MSYKLGKLPASNRVKLKFGDYLTSSLPTPPVEFGYESKVADWQMLGNDTVGDCAIAGPFHAVMLWNAEAGKSVNVNTDCTLKAYSAITGYNPAKPWTDQGSNIEQVARYWQRHGLKDADGKVHKIDAYLALEPGDVKQLWYAMYLFDGVGIGLDFPAEWMDAFNHGKPWADIPNPDIAGGHYVLGTGRRNGMINVVTWGKNQALTTYGYQRFNDESLAYLNHEMFINGKDLDGFNYAQLKDDLAELSK